jgi:hypothetical protein
MTFFEWYWHGSSFALASKAYSTSPTHLLPACICTRARDLTTPPSIETHCPHCPACRAALNAINCPGDHHSLNRLSRFLKLRISLWVGVKVTYLPNSLPQDFPQWFFALSVSDLLVPYRRLEWVATRLALPVHTAQRAIRLGWVGAIWYCAALTCNHVEYSRYGFGLWVVN